MRTSETVAIGSHRHRLLYRNAGGPRARNLARIGILVAVTLWGGLAFALLPDTPTLQENFSPVAAIGGMAVGGMLSLALGGFTWKLTRSHVLYFEIWPDSYLAVIRTPGLWTENIMLVPWSDFRGGHVTSPDERSKKRPLRIRLRSGKSLSFDHDRGEVPYGWAALNRFVEKCSLPDALPGDTGPNQPAFPGTDLASRATG